jgi:serine/threonine-protein kinase 11
VFEWAQYGALSSFVHRTLPEKTIAAIFAQIVSALAFFHGRGIPHNAVMPAHILLFSGGIAKLSGIGIWHSFEIGEVNAKSPDYVAPETFSEDDSVIDPAKEDVWSMGVSMYEVAFGRLPRRGLKIEVPGSASEELRDLLGRMLEVNPEKRLTLEEVKEHQFLREAEQTFCLPATAREVPRMGRTVTLREVAVCQCDEEYTFDGPLPYRASSTRLDRVLRDR